MLKSFQKQPCLCVCMRASVSIFFTLEQPFDISWMRQPEGLLRHLKTGLGRRPSKETSTTAQVPSPCCLQYRTNKLSRVGTSGDGTWNSADICEFDEVRLLVFFVETQQEQLVVVTEELKEKKNLYCVSSSCFVTLEIIAGYFLHEQVKFHGMRDKQYQDGKVQLINRASNLELRSEEETSNKCA